MQRSYSNEYRLKLYIPNYKWKAWYEVLEKNRPHSLFFSNFSQWVRNCLMKIPKSYLMINKSQDYFKMISKLKEQKSYKLEKTIWIKRHTLNALEKSKDILSLNQYVIYILEYFIFGGSSPDTILMNVSQLENRITNLEKRINALFDKEYLINRSKLKYN